MTQLASRFRLDDRVALVTGAGRGLGRSIALALAEAGAQTWLMARSRQEIEKVAEEIRAGGGSARAAVCDVTDGAAVRRIVAAMPALDVLINNAGMNIPEPFVEVTEDHLDRMLDLNVRAMFVVAQAATRKMLEAPDRKARGGAIVNITSQIGHELRRAVSRARNQRGVRRQGDRYESYAAHAGRGALHGWTVGRQVSEDLHLSGSDA